MGVVVDDRDALRRIAFHFHPPPRTGEIEQRPAEAVELINHDAIDLPGLDCSDKTLHRRAVHVPAGVAAVVEVIMQCLPALASLA